MSNPFEALPRQKAKEQAILDSIESNRGLEESVYSEIEYALDNFYIEDIEELFRKNNLNIAFDSRLYRMVKEAFIYHLDQYYDYQEEVFIENLKLFLKVTGYEPEWSQYNEKIQNIYRDYVYRNSLSEIEAFVSYTGIEPDWQGELKPKVMDWYARFIENEHFDKIKELQELSGIQLDWQGELKPKVMDWYGRFIENGSFDKIKKLQELSGIELDWEGELKPKVMEEYDRYIKYGPFDKIKELQELSGIKPDWEGELKLKVMKEYGRYIVDGSFDIIKELQELSGIEPDWEGELKPKVMKGYGWCIKNGYFAGIKELQELSGIEPDWEGELKPKVMEEYGMYIKYGPFDKIKKLQELSGIEPDWEGELKPKVMEKYGDYIYVRRYGWEDSILQLQKLSGIQPDWQGELKSKVMEVYGRYIKNGYFDKIKELQELSDIQPDWEGKLKPKVMEKYGDYISVGRYGWEDSILQLQKLSGIEPDWQGELKPKVMEGYGRYLEIGYFDKIKELQELSGIEPDWEGELKPKVMEEYGRYIENEHFDKIKKLQELSGVEPDWQGELKPKVMKEYGRCIENRHIDKIKKLQELSGIQPDWEGELKPKVMDWYGRCIENGYFDRIKKLQELSGIQPDWEGELKPKVMEKYGDYIFVRRYGWEDSILQLQKLSGIQPDWEGELKPKVMKGYGRFIKNEHFDKIKELQELSGIPPDWQGELKPKVMDWYGKYIKFGYFADIKKLQELSGIQPDWEGELKPKVMDLYGRYIEVGFVHKIKELQELSGIQLDWQGELKPKVMDWYGRCIENGYFADIKKLQELSGIEPDWEGELKPKVMEGYDRFIEKGYFDKVKELQELSGIELDWEGELKPRVMERYAKYLEIGYFDKIKELQELSGIQLDWQGELKSKVMEEYGKYIKNRSFDRIKELQELSGIEPDWEGELKPKVMEKYGDYISLGRYGWEDSILQLQELSGIEPDWEGELKPKVMEEYGWCIKNGYFAGIKELQEISGIEPDWEGELKPKVMEGYIYLLDDSRKELLKDLPKVTGITYDEAIKDTQFWDLVIKNVNKEVVEKVALNSDKIDPEVREAFEKVLNENYSDLLAGVANNNKSFEFVQFCIKDIKIKPRSEDFSDLVFKALNDSDVFNKLSILLKLCNYRGLIKFATDDIKGRSFDSRQIALIYALDMLPKEEEARSEFESQLGRQNNQAEIVKALLKARGVPNPASRVEYCPWKKELEPLLAEFDDFEHEDIPALVDYIQRFGMKNLPSLAKVSIDIYQFRDKFLDKKINEAEIKDVAYKFSTTESGLVLQQFLDAYGSEIILSEIKSIKDIDRIYALLEKVSKELKEAVIRDEMPRLLEQSPITMELFNSVMVRSGSWATSDHGYSRETLMAKWRVIKESEQFELPAFYQSRMYRLKSTQQESLDQFFKDEGDIDEKSKLYKLKETKREEKRVIYSGDEYATYLAPFYVTIANMDRLGPGLGGKEVVLANAITTLEAKLNSQRDVIEGIGDDPKQQKKKMGMQKGLEKQEWLLQKIKDLKEEEKLARVLGDARDALQNKIDALAIEKETAEQNLPGLISSLEQLSEQIDFEGESKELKKRKKDLQKEIQRLKSKVNQSVDEWNKDLTRLNGLLQVEDESNLTNESKEYSQHQRLLAAITYSFDQKTIFSQLGDAVRLLTMRMAELESRGHVEAIREAYKQNDKEEEFKAWKAFFQEQLLEHFIDPDYADEPRKVAMPSEVNGILESVWRLNNIRQKSIEAMSGDKKEAVGHPFVRAVKEVNKIDDEIRALEEEGTEALTEKVEVTYSPCHGLGRIFAGDVGDACYTSYRHAFADGKYPNLHSIILSKKEKVTEEIKLLGSVLLIEGKNVKGKKYLFARAVNPMDSVIKREIKADEFLKGLLDYLKTTAEKAGFDEAVLCVDTAAARSGSNRKEMFDTMQKAARDNNWPIADNLESTPETNFKYRVWDTQDTRVYRIWQREESK